MTSTNAQSYWSVGGLSSGNLRITTSAPGFKTAVQDIYYDASRPEHYNVSLGIAGSAESIEVSSSDAVQNSLRIEKDLKKNPPPPPPASANVFNLQQRVAGVLPVAVDVPRAGVSYRFLRPLVLNEETTLSFTYKSK